MDTFLGYERPDGSAGVRNHVAVLPTVSCANGVVAAIARQVPEVVPLYHSIGCGRGGADLAVHQRTIVNLCQNPNLAGLLIVGLGCEFINAADLEQAAAQAGKHVWRLIIQQEGGSRKTTTKGVKLARDLLAAAREMERTPVPARTLLVGLECGGSDAFSGVTANPAVGRASDRLVEDGATVILTETTEMIGTSHILSRRAATAAVGDKIVEIIEHQELKCAEVLGPLAKIAISPGNMDGGMSSIREKSLGCIVKSGLHPIVEVIGYAEKPTRQGVVIMNGPGYDTDSLTGMAAAGAQVIIFTTGRGNPIGFPLAPVIKVISTSRAYRRMEDDMDVNAGAVLEGRSLEAVGCEIYDLLGRVVNGEPTKAEINQQDGILCVYTQNTSL
ncbi:MAG: UxaA family hydrolase [Desulfobacterales bacterium]|nr:MAG: UxaA family hydrolase [Desulfobacterales bacterium]